MIRDPDSLFELGETFFGIGSTIDTTFKYSLLGVEKEFQDPNFTMKVRRMRLVRNSSGINLLPKMAVRYKVSSANDPCGFETEIDGYGAVNPEKIVLVDDQLPSGGVPNGDYFWVCVQGEHLGITAKSSLNSIVVGDFLVAQTAAASTFSTTAGRLNLIDLTGATTPLANQILYNVGHAMTARTTNNTDTDIRVNVGKNW